MARGPVAYPLVASSAPWLIPHSSLRCCGQQAHVARSPSSTEQSTSRVLQNAGNKHSATQTSPVSRKTKDTGHATGCRRRRPFTSAQVGVPHRVARGSGAPSSPPTFFSRYPVIAPCTASAVRPICRKISPSLASWLAIAANTASGPADAMVV